MYDSYLARVDPSKEIVDELAKLVIDSTIRRTVGVIVLTWSEDTITFQAQNSLQKVENVNENKVRFYCRIFGEMLKLTKWKFFHCHIYEALNKILLDILYISKEFQYTKTGNLILLFY